MVVRGFCLLFLVEEEYATQPTVHHHHGGAPLAFFPYMDLPLCTNCQKRPVASLGQRNGKTRYHKTKCHACRHDPGYDEKKLIAWERRQLAKDEQRRQKREAAAIAKAERMAARAERKKQERIIWTEWWEQTMATAPPSVVTRLKTMQYWARKPFMTAK